MRLLVVVMPQFRLGSEPLPPLVLALTAPGEEEGVGAAGDFLMGDRRGRRNLIQSGSDRLF